MQEEFSSKSDYAAGNRSPSEEDFQDFVSYEPVRHSQPSDSLRKHTCTEETSASSVTSTGNSNTGAHVCSETTEVSKDSVASAANGDDQLVGRDGQPKNGLETDRKACEGTSSEQENGVYEMCKTFRPESKGFIILMCGP